MADERAVVSEKYTMKPAWGDSDITFYPGEVVIIEDAKDQLVLVKSESRTFLTYHSGVWIPKQILLEKGTFKPLGKWIWVKHLSWVFPESSADFEVADNGTFECLASDIEGEIAWYGHFHRSKNILWATKNISQSFDPNAIFVVMPNGKLCWAGTVDDCLIQDGF